MSSYKRGKYKKKTKKRSKKSNKMAWDKKRVPLALKQHQFCERVVGDTIQIGNEAGAAAAPYFTKVFKFSDIPQCQSYSSIFEQYRLDKIVVTFRYKGIAQPSQLSGGPANVNELNPLLYFKVDHNDVAPNTLQYLKLSTKTKSFKFTNNTPEFSISLKPASQELLIRQLTAPVLSTNVPAWGKWIDADGATGPGSSVEHFGLKCYALGFTDPNFKPGYLDVEYKYYISCKSNE